MKQLIYLSMVLILTCPVTLVRAQSEEPAPVAPAPEKPAQAGEKIIAEIGILPGFKRGSTVDVNERNPYALRALEEETGDGETEAAQLRRILERLTVKGRTRGPNGLRILLGSLRLEQGKELPPLIENQNDRLVVTSVTEEEVEISWLTESGNQLRDARTLKIPINVDHDTVRVRLDLGEDGTEKSQKFIEVPFDHMRGLSDPVDLEQLGINGEP